MISLHLADAIHPNGQRVVWTWPSNCNPHLHDYVEIEVLEYRSGQWFVKVYLDFRYGPMWGLTRSFATQEEAATEAADAWAECVRIVHAHWRGEPFLTPWAAMGDAFDALPETIEAVAKFQALRGERQRIDFDAPAWMSERRRLTDASAAVECELRERRDAWFRATDWRPFRDLGAPAYMAPEREPASGQLPLLDTRPTKRRPVADGEGMEVVR